MECHGLHTHWVNTPVALLSVWHGDFLLFVHIMHTSGLLGCWLHSCSSPGATAHCFEIVLLPTWTACFSQMMDTASDSVMHHSIYSCLSSAFYSALQALVRYLSQLSYNYLCDQSLIFFNSSNAFFCTLCNQLFGSSLAPLLCLFHLSSFG